MPIVTQSRSLPPPTFRGQWYLRSPSGVEVPQVTDSVAGITGSQTTTSFRSKKGASPDYDGLTGPQLYRNIAAEYQTRYDNGHDFSTTSFRVEHPRADVWWRPPSAGGTYVYRGDVGQAFNFSSVSAFPTSSPLTSNSTLDLKGSKLVGLSVPTAAEAAAATFLGEIARDGFPRLQGWKAVREHLLRQEKKLNVHLVGDEYLNHQFGVMPFKRDIQKMALAVKHQSKLWKQLSRDSDRIVRRKHSLPRETQTIDRGTDISFSLPRMNANTPPAMFRSVPPTRVIDVITTDIWFTGAFTYHLYQAQEFLGKLDLYAEKADQLLGLEINLETLWDLTRWSWLVDWFIDVGSFLHNIDLFHNDSLVMRYGYVMCHSKTIRTRSADGFLPATLFGAEGRVPSSVQLVTINESKQRRRATPYGFGLDVQSFSSAKWAILGALGMTRAPKSLKNSE
jgi:hypothetical protein